MIRTSIRVNPIGYESSFLTLDSDIREICLQKDNNNNNNNNNSNNIHSDSWIVDELFDTQSIRTNQLQFTTQQNIYDNFSNWIISNNNNSNNSNSNSNLINSYYCIVYGGRNTGKSYTLFGENNKENCGIIPRFIQNLFLSSNSSKKNNNSNTIEVEDDTLLIQISMYLSYSDHFIDLLKPPNKYPYTNNVIYSPTLGIHLLPLKVVTSTTLEHSLHTIHLGLMSASMISLNLEDILQTSNLIVSIRVVTSQKSYTMTFIELSSFILLPTFLTESDRLTSSCIETNSINSLSFCGIYGESSQNDINGYKSKSNQSIRKALQLSGPYETSYLTYLLQDAFCLKPLHHHHQNNNNNRQLHQDQSYLSHSTFLIGCINASKSCLSDVKLTLDLTHSISEKLHDYQRQLELLNENNNSQTNNQNNNNKESNNENDNYNDDEFNDYTSSKHTTTATNNQSNNNNNNNSNNNNNNNNNNSIVKKQILLITDMIEELNNEIEVISNLLDEILTEKNLLEESLQRASSKGMLTSNITIQRNNYETLKLFNEVKLSYLLSTKEVLMRPYSYINSTTPQIIYDLVFIQKWLKNRGVFGIKLFSISNNHNNRRELSSSKSSKKVLESNNDTEIGTGTGTGILPWSEELLYDYTNRKVEPYLTPISCINLSNYYLHLMIPAGHMAICQEPIYRKHYSNQDDELLNNGEVNKISFPGIKHCKILKLDGLLIKPRHCIFFRLGTTIKIRPLPNEDEEHHIIVCVNGKEIHEETVLHDLDIITLGLDKIFIIHIPLTQEQLEEQDQQDQQEQGYNNDNQEYENNDNDNDNIQKKKKLQKGPQSSDFDLGNMYIPSQLPINIILNTNELESDNWDRCIVGGLQVEFLSLISTYLMNINHYKHSAIERQMIPITKIADLTDDMKLTNYTPSLLKVKQFIQFISPYHRTCLVELLLAVKKINQIAIELRRLVQFDLMLVKYTPKQVAYLPRQYRGIEEGIKIKNELYIVEIRCEVLDGSKKNSKGDSWVWSSIIFIQRFLQIQLMYSRYINEFESNLESLDEVYLPSIDPFYDPAIPELIGVSALHTDSLYYLIDTRDNLPIITYKGNKSGQIKLNVRIWIDKVETVPSYITVDKESKLIDFIGRMAIIRFYFEYLLDIPPYLSNDLQIIFSFFGHTGQYRTTRHPAMNIVNGDKNSYINSTIVIEQKITPDFIRYIQKKSIEFEVWGTRLSNREYVSASTTIDKMIRIGEPKRLKKKIKKITLEKAKSNSGAHDIEEIHHFDDIHEEFEEHDHLMEENHEEFEGSQEEDDENDKDENNPVELKYKIKEMSIQLEKAEKNMRRTTKAASTYRDELSKLNSKVILTEQTISNITNEKEKKIRDLEYELKQAKEEIEKEKELRRLEQEKKTKSKICTIS